MANVARLGVVMGLDTAEFSAGLQEAFKALDEFKAKIIELGSLAAFSEMTNKAMEYADSIVVTAKANDVTTASVLELSKALEENGGSAENTSQIYSAFNQKVESAALGSAKTQEAFSRLGVSLKDLATLSSQALFEKTIQSLAKIKDSVTRNGLAFQLLGKAIKGVDIQGLASTLEEAKGSMKKYAESVNQAHELHLELKASSKQILLVFTNAFIPTIVAMKQAFGDTTKEGGGIVGVITDIVNVIGVLFRYATTTVIGIVDTFKFAVIEIGNIFKAVISGNLDAVINTYKAYDDKIKAMVEADAKFADNLLNPKSGGAKSEADPQVQRQIVQANGAKIGAAKELSEEYKKQADLQLLQVEQARNLIGLTKDEIAVQQAVNKVIDANQKAQDAIDKKIAGTSNQTAQGRELISIYQQQKQAIADMEGDYIAKTQQAVQATIDYQKTFEFGWDSAFKSYSENATNYAKMATDMFNSLTNTMSNAIATFVKTGKINFGDLATSMISDMLRIQAQAMASRALSSLFGMGSGDGIFTGGAMTPGGAYGPSYGAFASGGSPADGVPSLVGENGPELFVPSRSGTIVPNNQLGSTLAGMGGGTTYNGPYIASMQAIDTQSAMQFIAKNQTAIWAANQTAQRSLPQSR